MSPPAEKERAELETRRSKEVNLQRDNIIAVDFRQEPLMPLDEARAIHRENVRRFKSFAESQGLTFDDLLQRVLERQKRGIFPAFVIAMATSSDDELAELRAKIKASMQKKAQKKANPNSATAVDSVTSTTEAPKQLPPPSTETRQLRRFKERQQKKEHQKQQQRIVDIQQTSPHSDEAEQAVISAMMQDCQRGSRRVIAEVCAKINENFYYVPAHRTIHEMLVSLWRADKPIDLVSFTEFLRKKDQLAAIGGPGAVNDLFLYIDKITGFSGVPAEAVGFYLDIVIEKFIARESIAMWTEGIRRAYQTTIENEGGLQQVREDIELGIASIFSLNGSVASTFEDAAIEIEKPIVTPEDVIEGVLHRGGKASFGGASKARKTFLMLDMGISVASGSSWFPGFPTRKGKVLYVNFELPKAFCWKRIRAICDERQITLEKGMLTVWNLRGRVRDWPRLQQQIRPDEFALIIIDPVYKLLLLVGENIRDENRTGGVATVLDQIDALTERTGAAVAFGAHFSKGSQAQKESIDRVSGSGVWARDPDAIVTFTALEDEDCYAVEMNLRNHAPQKPFSARWEYPVFVRADEVDPSDLKQRKPAGAAEKKFTVEQLVNALSGTEALSGLQLKLRIARKLKCSDRTAYRLFDEAIEVGAVSRKDLKHYEINKDWKPSE